MDCKEQSRNYLVVSISFEMCALKLSRYKTELQNYSWNHAKPTQRFKTNYCKITLTSALP